MLQREMLLHQADEKLKAAMETEPQLSRNSDVRLEKFFASFSKASSALLLLDYDGTLAPFRVDRFKARPWAGVRELLNRIQDLDGLGIATRMIFISGRPACEVGQLLGLDRPVEVWGLHGAERLHPDGTRELEEIPAATRHKLEMLRAELKRDSFGGLFEDKPNAAVMHWRGISDRKAQQIARQTRNLFEPLAHLEGVTLLEFEAGLELRAGRDKGCAVEAILAEDGEAANQDPVAFLGDDLTDEAAMVAVNASPRPHLSVLVKRVQRETAAEVWLQPPGELRKFLKSWIAACQR
jgi:trehalose 6-phosphate phosphatase